MNVEITEPRAALLFSFFAMAFTGWQTYLADKANALNQESLKIDVSPTDNPSLRAGEFLCTAPNEGVAYLTWKITIFNSSSQPVTIKDIFAYGVSGTRLAAASETIGKTGPIDKPFPDIIAAKGFKTIQRKIPHLFETKNCHSFGAHTSTAVPWISSNEILSYVNVTTGDGNKFTQIGIWK